MSVQACVEPATGERWLESAPGGEGVLSAEYTAHLATCVACQIALERMRRMASSWKSLEPTPREIAAARLRLSRRVADRGRTRTASTLVVFAIVLVSAAAFAGGRVWRLRLLRLGGKSAATSVVASPPAPPIPATRGPAQVVTSDAPPIDAAPAATSAPASSVAPAGDRSSTPTVNPPTSPMPSSQRSPTSPRALPPSVSAAAVPAPTTSGWAIAAEALRVGDYSAAEQAFGELARTSKDAGTRDQARLARAQVWMAQGRAQQARSELERLASDGSTPALRARAADALRTRHGSSLDRGAPGTNSP